MEKLQILFVAGMQWWGRLDDVLEPSHFDLFCEVDPDEANKLILSKKHFDLVICLDNVCPEDRHDGLHLAEQLRMSGHKVLVVSDFHVERLPFVTYKEFHYAAVELVVKIHGLIGVHEHELVAQ